jgi:hypothetical protein
MRWQRSFCMPLSTALKSLAQIRSCVDTDDDVFDRLRVSLSDVANRTE